MKLQVKAQWATDFNHKSDPSLSNLDILETQILKLWDILCYPYRNWKSHN